MTVMTDEEMARGLRLLASNMEKAAWQLADIPYFTVPDFLRDVADRLDPKEENE